MSKRTELGPAVNLSHYFTKKPVRPVGAEKPLALIPRRVLTSQDRPLQVDIVPTATEGRLGLTIAPGKHDPTGRTGHHQRDLTVDLARLRDHYKTELLVPLVEAHELTRCKIPTLVADAREAGMRVEHFPIVDGSVPGNRTAFLALIDTIVETLKGGGNVVVHCRGGMGRAGTIGACTLVRLGQSAKEAIRRVRQHRIGAVETVSQERFIAEFATSHARANAPAPTRPLLVEVGSGKAPAAEPTPAPAGVARAVRGSALLNNRQAAVYAVIAAAPAPMTRNEVNRAATAARGTEAQWDKRLAELARLDVIEKGPRRVCSVTGAMCVTWKSTGRLPTKPAAQPAPKAPLALAPADMVALAEELAAIRSDLHHLGADPSARFDALVRWLKG